MTTTFSSALHAPGPRRPPSADVTGYRRVRRHTEVLTEPLSAEDQVVQSMPDTSPTKWHRAHVTWFFEELVLAPNVAGYRWFDEGFRYLFNSYYEAIGPRQPRPRRGMITRPDVDTVTAYRAHVDEAMEAALEDGRLDDAALAMVELGLHHEQQHQELLVMDVQHLLWQNPFAPPYRRDRRPQDAAARHAAGPTAAGWLAHPGGVVEIGHDGPGFAYDNERPRHEVLLQPFELADRLVTCGDWLEFMADDGYRRAELWLSDGWHLLADQPRDAPLYWRHDPAQGWCAYDLHGLHPVRPEDAVSNVSYHEADAFARWAGARLPTEAEWEVLAAIHWEPGHDALELTGTRWQWTASAYLPYPGFAAAEGAVGEYNGKFMVNQHVLRGGSHATPAGHERVTYRNFFPPSAQWAFSGVRLARG